MGSTLGGFILGMSTFSLIICVLLAYVSNTIYVSFYNEMVSYENYIDDFYIFTHSPSSIKFIEEYKELSILIPFLEDAVKKYNESYPRLIKYRYDIEKLYNFTHSDQYDILVEKLKSFSKKSNDISRILIIFGYSGMATIFSETLPALINLTDQAKELSETAIYFYNYIDLIPPEKLKKYIDMLKTIISYIPPDKMEEYFMKAKDASEKAIMISNIVKKYPPELVLNYIILISILSVILCIIGILLILKSNSRKIYRSQG